MKYYIGIVHKIEDSALGVTFPDLPGCFSAADRAEDVVPNASEAIALWFDGRDDVKPSSLDRIREGALDDLAEGAYLVAVPRRP